MSILDRIGHRSLLTCPECNGVMWEIDEGDVVRYRCHVGHAYTAELMNLAMDETLRRALGSAARALDERIALARKLHQQASASGHKRVAETWTRKQREAEDEAQILRDAMQRADQIAARYAKAGATEEAGAADEAPATEELGTGQRRRAL